MIREIELSDGYYGGRNALPSRRSLGAGHSSPTQYDYPIDAGQFAERAE